MAWLWSFTSGRGFLNYCRQKSSPTIIFWGKAPATWPNKYNWFKSVIVMLSEEKKCLGIALVGANWNPFQIQYLFSTILTQIPDISFETSGLTFLLIIHAIGLTALDKFFMDIKWNKSFISMARNWKYYFCKLSLMAINEINELLLIRKNSLRLLIYRLLIYNVLANGHYFRTGRRPHQRWRKRI